MAATCFFIAALVFGLSGHPIGFALIAVAVVMLIVAVNLEVVDEPGVSTSVAVIRTGGHGALSRLSAGTTKRTRET